MSAHFNLKIKSARCINKNFSFVSLVNLLFILILISNTSIIKTSSVSISNKHNNINGNSNNKPALNDDYTLLFELQDEDMPELDKFSHIFKFDDEDLKNNNDNEGNENSITSYYSSTSEYNEYNKFNEYGISNEDINDYIQENEDYIDDFSYVENYETLKRWESIDKIVKELPWDYKVMVAKELVMNAFRNAPIYYEEDIVY